MYSHPCEPMGQAALTHFIRLFYSWNFVMSQRTVEQPELKDLPCTGVFFNSRHFFFFSKFMLINISVVNILSSPAESTLRVSISSQPISPSETNKNAVHMMSKRRDEGLLSEFQD